MTVPAPVPHSRPTLHPSRGISSGRPGGTGLTNGAGARLLGSPAADERGAVRAVLEDTGFDIRSSTSAHACTVTVVGEVDSMTAPFLRGCLLDVLGRPGVYDVVVDLSRVTFLSAAGLTALSAALQAANRADRALRIRCGTARSVTRVLQICGLCDDFTLVE